MRIFSFDPSEHTDTYARRGWVHVRDGVTPEFLDHLREYVHRRSTEEVLHGTGIRGAKDQYLYDPAPGVELSGELCGVVSAMCGLDPASFTLAERHIKSYANDADPAPVAHKDRLASQVSIGVSIEVPEGSHLVLWPDVHREVNHFLTAELRESLAPDERPDVILRDVPGTEIYDRPGDVVLFPGSAVWHLRRKSASTVNLYLKCNDFDCDPLGEDPSTEQRRLATAERLSRGGDALGDCVAVLSRRLEWVGTLVGRDGVVRPFAKMWDRPPIILTDDEFALLEHLGARGTTGGAHAGTRPVHAVVDDAVARLARREVVDLLAPGDPSWRDASRSQAAAEVGAGV